MLALWFLIAPTASADHASGVSFLVKDPLSFSKPESAEQTPPSARVQVFNGSSARETIRVRPASQLSRALKVEPATRVVAPGRVATFTVSATATDVSLSGVLRAQSSDGTIAARDVSIAPVTSPAASVVPPPDSLTLTHQQPLFPRGADVGGAVTLPGLAGSAKETSVGFLSDGHGHATQVKVEGEKVSVDPVDNPGEYKGTLNLVPSVADGPKTAITFKLRDNWLAAAILLVIGLFVATGMEWWLTRGRPPKQLAAELERLRRKADGMLDTATSQLAKDPPADSGWKYPPLTGDPSLFKTVSERVKDGMARALSDAERTDFGPDGDEIKKLETVVDDYEKLLGYSGVVIRAFGALMGKTDADQKTVADLGEQVGELLNGETIATGAQLSVLQSNAEELVKAIGKAAHAGTPAVQALQHAVEAQAALTGAALTGAALTGAAISMPSPPGLVPTTEEPQVRILLSEDKAFTALSWALVFASGMSALYFNNETFGSSADYLGMFLWGSAAQGGVSLVRRLLPGGVQSITTKGS